ncbi:MAG: SOS response-associated peptidase [Sulfobacillus sp.]
MCGRFSLGMTITQAQQLFPFMIRDLKDLSSWQPQFNIAPGSDVLTLVGRSDQVWGGLVRWGWPAPWNTSQVIINARIESLGEKPSFRNARRALVLADSFYEWHQQSKQPYRILPSNQPLFPIAAIVQTTATEPAHRVILVTKAADESTKNIHPRVPLILTPKAASLWLAGDRPLASEKTIRLNAIPISHDVNNARTNSKDLHRPMSV